MLRDSYEFNPVKFSVIAANRCHLSHIVYVKCYLITTFAVFTLLKEVDCSFARGAVRCYIV